PEPSTQISTQTLTPSPEKPGELVSVPQGAEAADAQGRITGAAQASLQSGPNYQASVLYHHNRARANHGAPPLVWDAACEAGAKRTADMCIFAHPSFLKDLKQGQNLYTRSGSYFNVTGGITENWYKKEFPAYAPYFGKEIPSNLFPTVFPQAGHLTAMLWKGTSKVGCVSLDCGTRMKMGDGSSTTMNKFTVCNYAPAGNVIGQFAANVGVPIQTANLGSWLD
ncbi:PR-1-like protein, partial [Sporormia fimetaria CBS 119925]